MKLTLKLLISIATLKRGISKKKLKNELFPFANFETFGMRTNTLIIFGLRHQTGIYKFIFIIFIF